MSKVYDHIGVRFGRLLVLTKNRTRSNFGQVRWDCVCDCGKHATVKGEYLRRGVTQSCGCLAVESRTKHGMWHTAEYKVWAAMVSRCSNRKLKTAKNYAVRGVGVSERWKASFENFYDDMGPRPKSMTLERRDNDKGYSKSNCRWATRAEQMRNTRCTHHIEYEGKTMCVVDWAKEKGINQNTLYGRVYRGLTGDALFAPLRYAK